MCGEKYPGRKECKNEKIFEDTLYSQHYSKKANYTNHVLYFSFDFIVLNSSLKSCVSGAQPSDSDYIILYIYNIQYIYNTSDF